MEEELEGLVRLRLLTHNIRLIEARKEMGLTQAALAKLLEWPPWRLSQIEGLKRAPDNGEQAELASTLGKPCDYLFPEALLDSIRVGVFSRRQVDLRGPEIISLTESALLQLAYDGETALIEEVETGGKLLQEQIDDVLRTLKPRESEVLRIRYGLDGGGPKTLEEIGKFFNVTRERIRQMEAKALRKLRHSSRSWKLIAYLK